MSNDSLQVLKRSAAELFNRAARIHTFLEETKQTHPQEYGQPCVLLGEALTELESNCVHSIAFVQGHKDDPLVFYQG
jgi:hypothetical protein